MSLRHFFVAKGKLPPIAKGEAIAAADQNPGSVGVFVTPESLSSFPIASLVVSMLWFLCQKLWPAWGQSAWAVVVLAFLVGGAIFLYSVTDQNSRPVDTRAWVLALVVGFINCLLLACSALGILKAPSALAGSHTSPP